MFGNTVLIVACFGIALVSSATICKRSGSNCKSDADCCSRICDTKKCVGGYSDMWNEEPSDFLEETSSNDSDMAYLDLLSTILLEKAGIAEEESSLGCKFPGFGCGKNKDCCSHRCLPIVKRCSV